MMSWTLILIDLVKLLVAMVLGILIGSEREHLGKPAGMRTLALVCLGSTLATILGINYFPADPTRIIQGIITGLGFLGAGVIIADSGSVKGLTTAASVWTMAIVGIVIGLGEYAMAIIASILIYVILELNKNKPKKSMKKIRKIIRKITRK